MTDSSEAHSGIGRVQGALRLPSSDPLAGEAAETQAPSLQVQAVTSSAARHLPLLLVTGFAVAALVALSLPLRLPLGAFYWDVAVYLDAFHRIGLGQAPAIDFFAPVGPLSYYLGALLQHAFPDAQPMLVVNWAVLPLVLPLALIILYQRDASRHGLALLVPFLIFAALPVNLSIFYPAPGLDGFGNYNRQTALLLYWLVATLLFVEPSKTRTLLVAAFMLALFLLKITGAVVGAVIVGYACLVGRLRLADACAAAAACILALLVIDWPTGLVRAYLEDVLTLLSLNEDTLLPRLLTVASAKFGVVLPASALVALLLWTGLREGEGSPAERIRRILAGSAGWLAVTLFALTLFETQNTGSLEFIALWPVLLLVLQQWRLRSDQLKPVVVAVTLAVALPSLMLCIERGARALAGMAGDVVALPAPELGPLARVSVKRGLAERAAAMVDFYPAHAQAFRALSDQGLEPSAILAAEIDYQATWLLEVRQGLLALRDWEVREQRRLNGIFTLDFVDPFNALLDRDAPRFVPIGITPGRSLPEATESTLASLAETDAILAPKCPLTPARIALAKHYAASLADRRRIELSPCWDMYLKVR
ncbi:MAG TPA: hypothetical protein VGN82_13305 [Bosea sp. (in: a-proteobacteria)]|jgi:hypothetical protein|uniref:hypothetical protein n=1 Tax=Bosea sp. (in: a-proteobacteria) TaxID=1871050 RepID=UPI002E13A78F|nr:hypothetical protein [Bosea sp. (in: a-proteobacteria)]